MATVNIPLTTLTPGRVVTLPSTQVPVGVTEYTLSVNRNVGIASLDATPSAQIVVAVDYSLDAGATWNPGLDPATAPHYSTSTISGGVLSQQTNRVVQDGVTVIDSAVVTSATAAFTTADIGRVLGCANLPSGTTIQSVESPTSVTASAPATNAGVDLQLVIKGGGTPIPIEVSTDTTTIPGNPSSNQRRVRATVTNGPVAVSVSGSLTTG